MISSASNGGTQVAMSTFARTAFGHASYASFRPTYSPSLFRTILAYHNERGGHGTALDMGCGHGIMARELAPHFDTVHAIDPAAGMVEQARTLLNSILNIHVRQAGSEDLSFLPDDSVDLVVAGQAAHWFDFGRAWPELARVVRSGGSLAFAGYKDHVLVGHPEASEAFRAFSYGEGEVAPGIEGMGRFWEFPGRGILRDSYAAIQPPASEWEGVRRLAWDPDAGAAAAAGVEGVPQEVLWQRHAMTLGQLEGYVRTYSAYSNWREAHPQRRRRAEGGEGDVVDAMFDAVVDAVPAWRVRGEAWRDVEVDAVWGSVILLARRR
ncbi:uncharacterized protein E0L32_000288 [Thyridium curvatum]|uniref:Methyltransferase type 11 domain-containing protein n=1 Tax=Thyridium curvatum TaxID=1093900 RepID=A0A507BBE4_9PEZI|nr:uncharacterized protein E0L32_000288 [Thyridium curvatum]TPX15954.1 hypothetical protein E0L32_000288 [Thyridium curvatum]